MNKVTILLSIAVVLSATAASAQRVEGTTGLSFVDIMPTPSGMLNNVVIDSQVVVTKGSQTRINLHLSCYATNLRSVANPVSANSLVSAYLDIRENSGGVKTFKIQFPAEYLKPASERIISAAQAVKLVGSSDPAVKIQGFDNVIQVILNNVRQVSVSSSGEVSNLTEKNLTLAGIRFAQEGVVNYGSPYTGVTGPLSANVVWYTSVDGKSIDIHAAFPGAAVPGQRAVVEGETRTGFCGGYYSPLMLFFDDVYPRFTGKSDFLLRPHQIGKIHWPEAGSQGYFLTRSEHVKSGEDLFGDSDRFDDGFANLASQDLNKDGVIDRRDPIFKQLRLWRDIDGDGRSSANEMSTLRSHGVESLQVEFQMETKKFGDRAEYRQKSEFKFKKDGKIRVGEVLDIWLSPALGEP